MKRVVATCSTLFALLAATPAIAADDAEPAPVQVKIYGDPSLDMRIVGRSEAEPLAICRRDCQFWALPGRYTVYTLDHTTGATHELNLRLNRFAEYHLVQGNTTVHALGVGLEIGGAAASVIGLLTVLSTAMSQICESNCRDDNNGRTVLIGLGIMAGGIATGIVGFGLETSTRTRLVSQDEWSEANQRPLGLRFGIIPAGSGLGLGATAQF